MKKHIWGVSTTSRSGERMETVEFTVHYEENEPYIHQRLNGKRDAEKSKRLMIIQAVFMQKYTMQVN